jgi:hypothetical protein
MKKDEFENWADDVTAEMVNNLNHNIMMEHIEYVELGIRPFDIDYLRALQIRAEQTPEGDYLKPSILINTAITYAAIYHKDQTRKGKRTPYISHPLQVGEILSRVTDDEQVIAAGILHDTIEDTPLTYQDIEDMFGKVVAGMVNDVTEQDKSLSWDARKQQALDHIANMSYGSQLVKAADVIQNFTEQLIDYQEIGDELFTRFKAPKEKQFTRYGNLIKELQKTWAENPLLPDLIETYETFSAAANS